jgi:hypothetical protein
MVHGCSERLELRGELRLLQPGHGVSIKKTNGGIRFAGNSRKKRGSVEGVYRIRVQETRAMNRQAWEEIAACRHATFAVLRESFHTLCQIHKRILALRKDLGGDGGLRVDPESTGLDFEWTETMRVFRERMQQFITLNDRLDELNEITSRTTIAAARQYDRP